MMICIYRAVGRWVPRPCADVINPGYQTKRMLALTRVTTPVNDPKASSVCAGKPSFDLWPFSVDHRTPHTHALLCQGSSAGTVALRLHQTIKGKKKIQNIQKNVHFRGCFLFILSESQNVCKFWICNGLNNIHAMLRFGHKRWWIWLLVILRDTWWGQDVVLWCESVAEKLHMVGLHNLPQCDLLFSVINKKYQFVRLGVAFYHCLQSGIRFGRLVTGVEFCLCKQMPWTSNY